MMPSSVYDKQIAHLRIPLEEIASATENFSGANFIRKDGFGSAYKGQLLRPGELIDIVAQRLDLESEQGRKEFWTEVSMVSTLNHENLVSMVGFCDEGKELIVVYTHDKHGSLDEYLSGRSLTWMQRLQICVGVARALSYIHYDEGRDFSVIHCNIKSSKISLDANWKPKLFGFQLSMKNTAARRHRLVLDKLRGSIGYIDPRYEKTGGVTYKSDVYSFGVVLFEVMCGRRAFTSNPEGCSSESPEQYPKEESQDEQVEGQSSQLFKQHSNDRKPDAVDEIINPPLTKQGDPPSLTSISDISALMQPPSSSIRSMREPLGSSVYDGYMLPISSRTSFEQPNDEQQRPRLNPLCTFICRRNELLHIPDGELLAPLAIFHYEERKLDDMIDPDLRKQMDPQSFQIFSETAYYCLKDQRSERPEIDQILIRLEKALDLQQKHENRLTLYQHSEVAAEVEGTSTNYSKWKNLEHLKFGFHDIELATQNFSKTHRIGSGGFGDVYKAELEHFDRKNSSSIEGKNINDLPKISSTVAVKRLFKREGIQAEQSFSTEIETLTSCNHPNIVSLLGFCDEGSHMILVYEYVSKGSLDDYLGSTDNMINLKWAQRLQMCLDIAEGLDYLHTKQRIIHRDIKSANILLEHNWVAKIADFGLSKIGPKLTQISYLDTDVAGTIVYLDPEYMKTNKLKKASDIYSFGVVLFEILSGRLAYDPIYDKGFAAFARQHFHKGTLKDMLDPKLKEEFDENTFTLSKGPNQDSLDTFLTIAYQCLAETQAHRPKIGTVIKELKKALYFQKNHKDMLHISLGDILLATNNFDRKHFIAKGGFGSVYKGEVTHTNGRHTTIAAKRLDTASNQAETEFLMELEIHLEYKHENVIGFVGYCNEPGEKIIVYEYASRGSLDRYVSDKGLMWMKRLEICIDIASGLDFLHGGGGVRQEVVIHRDIKSANILLNDDWQAKVSDFGLSLLSHMNKDMDFVIDNACGTFGYLDPQYYKTGFVTRESDIYSLGVVLFEMLCGRLAFSDQGGDSLFLAPLAERKFENGKLDEIVFEGIKEQTAPKSLTTFQSIALRCIHSEREQRPTAGQVLLQLKKALEFQEDYDVWEPKLPNDYENIIKMSNSHEINFTEKKKDLYDMFSKGVLLQDGKLLFTLGANGEMKEMISAKRFSYINRCRHKWRSITESRFEMVAKMLDILNLKIKIKTRTQLLSSGVVYGVYLVFKFCDPRKVTSKPLYVNLKYKNGSKVSHAYFATWRDNEWMMIELCRFLNNNTDTVHKFLLESLSRYYCGDSNIFVEGLEFRPIDNTSLKVKDEEIKKLKEVQQLLKSDQVQQFPTNPEEILKRSTHDEDGEKMVFLRQVNGKKHVLLSAKAGFYKYPGVNLFTMKPSTQSRFSEVIELLPQQVFRISCTIKSQMSSQDTDYRCYLVFKLSEKCCGLHCPVKVRDLLHRNNKELQIIYFRSPSPWNLHYTFRAPEQREDGWMEVQVWKFNFNHELKNDRIRVNLKLTSYEGTMSGLILSGLEFRPV